MTGEHPRFGRLVGQHTGSFGAGGWLWYIGAIMIAAGVVNCWNGLMALIAGATGDGGTNVAMGVVCGLIGAPMLLVAVMRWRQSVDVFERGLVHRKLLGPVEIAFAEVRGLELVHTRSKMGTTSDLHVKLQSGSEVTIGSVSDIEQLASMIRNGPR